jgi:drug/metabolite transporter (DMT)-like permease
VLGRLRGEIYLILGATLFAFNGVVAKVVLAEGLSPWRLTQVRSGGAFLILITFFLLFKRYELRATRQEVPWLIAFGVVAVVLVQALYFVAIGRIYLGTALLIEFTAPIWILLFMRFVLKKQVDRLLWLALALSFSGLIVVTQVWRGLTLDGIGLLAAFLDSIALAGYFLIAEKLGKTKTGAVMTVWGFGIGTLIMAFMMPLWSFPTEYFTVSMQLPGFLDQYSLPGWMLIGWVVVFGTLLPYLFVIAGLRILSASKASIIGILEPVLASLFAWFLLREVLNDAQIFGAIIALVGIYLANLAKNAP